MNGSLDPIAEDRIHSAVLRVERLREEIAERNADISEIYKDEKSAGLDPVLIKRLVAKRAKIEKNPDAYERQENEFDLYEHGFDRACKRSVAPSRARARGGVDLAPIRLVHSIAEQNSASTDDGAIPPVSSSVPHAAPAARGGLPVEISAQNAARPREAEITPQLPGTSVNRPTGDRESGSGTDEACPSGVEGPAPIPPSGDTSSCGILDGQERASPPHDVSTAYGPSVGKAGNDQRSSAGFESGLHDSLTTAVASEEHAPAVTPSWTCALGVTWHGFDPIDQAELDAMREQGKAAFRSDFKHVFEGEPEGLTAPFKKYWALGWGDAQDAHEAGKRARKTADDMVPA